MLPSLQLRSIDTAHYFVSGDVTIHEGAAIAPGVLIQAAPESRIVIGVGACIGLGSVIHAHGGTIEIGAGASIGAGVLLVGQVKIGAHACVGSSSTIMNGGVEAEGVVPPGSLMGDRSRPVEGLAIDAAVKPPGTIPTHSPTELPTTDTQPSPETPKVADPWVEEALETSPNPEEPPTSEQEAGANVYGQVYVNNLLVKLFPNQRNLNQPGNGHLNGSG
ncbi:MAG: carbon dioxide concentrating mechanism protein [Leptolyngbyaceae cyanobacterium CSU_1_3]|nr:carbon dioxide concentrating mechanism protein [Leptolyngbyaceae cyanobacterium CSU_1_3]